VNIFTSPHAVVLSLLLFAGSTLQAQTRDTIRTGRQRNVPTRTPVARPQGEVLSRAKWRLAGKYSFGSGIGLEYAPIPALSLEVNTTLLSYSAKGRIFVMNSNITPFLSGGVGYTGDHYGVAGTTKRWIEAQVGVERALDHGFMRIQLHYTVDQSAGLEFPLFIPDFTIGYRF
jgi:hypothetical protein